MPTYIEDETLNAFIDEVIPMLQTPNGITLNCCHCGYPIRYPLMVSDSDRDAFRRLLELANDYLYEKGVSDKMLNTIKFRAKMHMDLNELKRAENIR